MKLIVENSIEFIRNHIEDDLSVELIAQKFGYSKHHFSRIFSNQTGKSPRDYIIDLKLYKAANEIILGSKIIDAALKYGYETHSGFSKVFKKKFNYSPSILAAIRVTEMIILLEGGGNMTHTEIYNEIKEELQSISSVEQMDLLEKAYDFAVTAHEGLKRHSGEDYVTHPLNVAHILAKMELLVETIVIGLLHDCNEQGSNVTVGTVKDQFGMYYYQKLLRINELNISKNLLNEVNLKDEEDIVLVKLADRLHNMMTLKYLDESRWKLKAEETIRIFSPLAGRLVNNELKTQLDSLSIAVLDK